ncbi:hypothetical protein [Parapedobacter pyrenivorans]|uniref:hypothetical protein n=1 Tax=Parapedobacter pyrenivorans TaxID=1305674 RepID=UPI00334219A9
MTVFSKVFFWFVTLFSLTCLCGISTPENKSSVSEFQNKPVDERLHNDLAHLSPLDFLIKRLRSKQKQLTDTLTTKGFFEGSEPFWSLKIINNRYELHCINDTEIGVLTFSEKAKHSESFSFKADKIFGTIRKSNSGGCLIDITEEENPTHEIVFSYKNTTYAGCGKFE